MGAMTGLFGGAFDPPHVGHVSLARVGVERFGLDRLLVRVVASPGHKQVATRVADRLALARLAFADVTGAEVALDLHARTVDSLAALDLDDPLFLVGADEFASFLSWKEPERVLAMSRLGVATRPGYPQELVAAVLERVDRPDRVTFFEIPEHEVSSSAIRGRVAEGESIEGLVAPAVAAEIGRLRLYQEPRTDGGRRVDCGPVTGEDATA
jgi:nicotinate-nucleotide adenylyltransferase